MNTCTIPAPPPKPLTVVERLRIHAARLRQAISVDATRPSGATLGELQRTQREWDRTLEEALAAAAASPPGPPLPPAPLRGYYSLPLALRQDVAGVVAHAMRERAVHQEHHLIALAVWNYVRKHAQEEGMSQLTDTSGSHRAEVPA